MLERRSLRSASASSPFSEEPSSMSSFQLITPGWEGSPVYWMIFFTDGISSSTWNRISLVYLGS